MNFKWIFAAGIALFSTWCAAAPASYTVDSEHSRPRFTYGHFGFATQAGVFNKMSGKIVLDPDAKTGSVDVAIEVDSLSTGFDPLDKHLKGGDFFNVSKFPQATFKSNSVTFDGDRPVSINGILTLRGVSQPVTFNVTSFKHAPHSFRQNRDALGGNAMAVVSRTAFGLGRFTPSVSDDVTIIMGLEALRD